MRHAFVVAVLLLQPIVLARAQDRTPGTYVRDARLAQARKVLDDVITDGTAGSAIGLVARNDRVLFLEAAGDMGDGTPMATDAIVRLASMTKPITATAVLVLVERGKLALSDPVDRWFPGFGARVADSGGTVAATRRVTVFDLLTHQAGVATQGAAYDSLFDVANAQEFATRIGRMPLRFQPGSRFEYGCCGSAYEVLGAIVERVSDMSLQDFLTVNVLKPLGMNDTYFFVPSEKANRIPAQYRKRAGALVQSRERGNEVPVSQFHSGAGGLRSSIHDYHRFARFLLNAGELDGVRLLKADMARRITTNQVGDNYPEAGLGWGMGVEVRTSTSAGSPQSVGAFGWGGGTGTQFLADPSSGLIAIVFVPTFPGTPGVSAARVAFIRAAYGASAP